MHMMVVQSSKCRNLGTHWQFSLFVSSTLLTYLHLCVTLGTFQLRCQVILVGWQIV